ncbi:MAG: ferrous iron transport protein A [Candidatus Hydrogenedentes bacterium]|nr:ferrous iron transport protein A [Candidatus Hydrogenedentota bacterium]
MTGASVRPLSTVPAGGRVTVVSLAGGGTFRARMISMGLTPGCELQVMQANPAGCGQVIVAFGGTRLAIGHGMAEKILIMDGPAR